MPSERIVVAGAGIVGVSIAYHLAKRGVRVTLVEARQPGCGATGKSFGWINATFSKRPRAYFDLNLLGIAAWRRLELEMEGELKIQWGGSVAWFPTGTEAGELRQNVRSHRGWDYATRLIDEPEFQRLLPAVSPGGFSAACYCEQEGAVDPIHAVHVLLRKAQALGVEVRYPCAVTGLDPQGVQTNQGPVETGTLVLACGVDSPGLARMAGVRIPLKDSPGVLVHTALQPKLIERVVLGPGVHFKQNLDGRIVCGGQIVAGAGTATSDGSVDQAEQILRDASRFLPQLGNAAVDHVTLGYRVMPVDEYPIVGFAASCPNLYVAAMHSGVTLAPLIGQLAAQEILDRIQVGMLDSYRPSRFAG